MSADDVLMPGGNPIGRPGGQRNSRQDIREVPGGQQAKMSIADSKELVTLLEDILDECEDDHVGLWSVIRDVRAAVGNLPSTEIKGITLELLRFLLHRHLIEAGFSTGRDFKALNLPADEIIQNISLKWDELGRDPSGGEIVWFTTPAATQN